MNRPSVYACRDATGDQWQLGPLPPAAGSLTLIGWSQTGDGSEGGVPREVAEVLARALTSIARVTFLHSRADRPSTTEWSSSSEGDWIRVLAPGSGLAGRLKAALRGIPSALPLTSTRRPAIAMHLFEDEGFPWWMQGQVALLSPPDEPPPTIETMSLLALFEDDWTEHAAALVSTGVTGIVRPGVDGDVAGVLSSSLVFEQQLLTTLGHETRLAGFEWELLTGPAFALK